MRTHRLSLTPRWSWLFMMAACLLAANALAAEPAPLRAGIASCDITPTMPVMLAGYASRKELSQGVHDPLSARVVAFENGGQRLVLVSCDLIGFYYGSVEPIRKAILDATQLKPSELFLSATHTHSGPWVNFDPQKGHTNNVEYSKALQGKLVETVRAALENLAPVQIGVGSGASSVGANRRLPGRDKAGNPTILLNRNPAVMTDREVQVLKLTRAGTNDVAAVLFAYATHSTSLGAKNLLVSGDVHGLAEQFLEKYLGCGVVAAAFAGASGDIDPWFRVLPGFKTNNGWIPEPVLLGTMLGEEVAHVLEGIQPRSTNCTVRTMLKAVEFPRKPRVETTTAAVSPPQPFHITVGRVGDIAFVGLGGEVYNAIGKAIKTASPFPHTFIITHCNGAAGYVPTKESYADGGYEVRTTPYEPGAGERLAEEVGRMLRDLGK
ncbi:MAG: neutral/alkaline non-lysosomal ceramidase N-terminal domain-containing protein [Verrucomicrobia bacterium]|nr:neutral/alkaline non-lysosomal ceramidase N-terminal domain-containing protein [Verrucomicrobiota bacterium]